MSAAARAEARRKAILARGGDRLAKLTTSARGEDAPAFTPSERPLSNRTVELENFVGEESPSPPLQLPRSTTHSRGQSPFTSAGLGAPPDPSVWSEEQQRQFMHALMGAGLATPPGQPQHPQLSASPSLTSSENVEDPLAKLMASMANFDPQSQGGFPGAPPAQATSPPKPPSCIRKFMPLVHILATWILLAYFVFWKEPAVFDAQTSGALIDRPRWTRWAELAQRNAKGVFGVQWVPFFWAFTTLQVVLHSFRIFSGFDSIRPPTLLQLALPHIPPPFPTLILSGMKYFQMGGMLLDDLAALLFAVGFIVFVAGWVVA
ncbi:hypothetical protein JAAARDRAFT_38115 [Jaapia argillacea MUCL 33604]|uniref:Golgi to ER traffic protein 2 n=1 Tax=Jaapia argillacea MUCL 33604 TaxID=933084 RepID=A0A067PJD5_9AGAM|nr:hypothetical protein JAAARDRAFT_38115 [Jaapia argillacea MUCL 33604]